MAEPQQLNSTECLGLLRSGVFGRVAISTPDGPHIIPVNYSIASDMVVFRTTPYGVLGTYGRDTQMAFEIDHVDYEYGTGWSVLAQGRSKHISDSRELDEIIASWSPHPWASGQRNLYLGLRWTALSGRRLGPVIDPWRDLPVNRKVSGL
jgi:uncharacterized protein